MRFTVLFISIAPLCLGQNADWSSWGGDPGGTKYSPLKEINRVNVQSLRPLWTFDVDDFSDAQKLPVASAFEATPLVIDGTLYISTPFHRLFALDAETGAIKWMFDPKFDTSTRVTLYQSRGVSYSKLLRRIYMADQQARLFSLDPTTGKPDAKFGDNGVLDLRRGMVEDSSRSQYGLTSPPAVCGTTIITGAATSDAEPLGPSGDVRGWDGRTGKLKWRFHTVPHAGEFGNDTWSGDSWKGRGGANVWSIMSVDEKRSMVFLPVTSPSFDYYGGDRTGANLFGDSVVALDCETGVRKWHFQTVHHNVWDYDLPSQPMLVTVKHGGRNVDAVAQATKTGFVFLLDRVTGKPLFPVEERPVEPSAIPGEHLWPTQPFPVKPPPFARQSFKLSELTTVTPESRKECEALIRGAVVEGGLFRPVTDQPTAYFPGTNGGSNWGGGSFDPTSGTYFINSMDVGAFMKITPRPDRPGAYRAQGYGRFWDSNRYPCQQPPWGSLTAIDLNTGELKWRAVLGEYDELTARGIPKTGASNLGGSMVTAGGLVFIGATNDSRFRAFDKDTGRQVWEYRLPATAHATPMTYTAPRSGRQFIAIAAGGGNKYNRNYMAKLMVFALPKDSDAKQMTTIVAPRRLQGRMREGYAGAEEKLPVSVAAQPAPFSHLVHSTKASLKCADCHATAATEDRAGFPPAAKCRGCHESMTRAEPRWVRVYELPGFVFFSHARHVKAGTACSACHGPVEQRNVLAKEVSTSMTSCIACHREKRARTDCTACHLLGQ